MGSGAWRAQMQSILPFPMGGLWLQPQLWREDFEILGSFECHFLQIAHYKKTAGAMAKKESRLHRWQSDLWLDCLQVWLTWSQWPCLWIKQVVDLLHDFVVTWYSVVCVAWCNFTESAYVLSSWGMQSYRTFKILYIVVHLKHIPW
jgi:hypothetical protein